MNDQVVKLTTEALVALARAGDRDAAHRIVAKMEGAIATLARAAREGRSPTSDLMQEGRLAVLVAIKQFNPDKGVKFSTFCWQVVKRALQKVVKKEAHWHSRRRPLGSV